MGKCLVYFSRTNSGLRSGLMSDSRGKLVLLGLKAARMGDFGCFDSGGWGSG